MSRFRKTPGTRSAVLAVAGLLLLGLVFHRAGLKAAVDHWVAIFRDAGPAVFFTAMAIAPVFGFPLSPFAVVAGPVFGPTLGVGEVAAFSLLALALNSALSYWLAAFALRPLVTRLVAWLGYRLPEIPPRCGAEIVLMARLIPGPPFWLQSCLLGLARAPFGIYLAVSTLVPAVYFTAAILLGDGLVRGDRACIAAAAGLFIAIGLVVHWLRLRVAKAAVAAAPDRE